MAATEEERWHTLDDGTKLYTKTWKPTGEIRAKLVFIHGFSDHCGAYHPLFPLLTSRGIEVLGFDQRGWGRSVTHKSQRGLTGPTTLVMSDITAILSSQIPSAVPLFLMGHSMGGAEVLTYAAVGPAHVRKHIRGYLAEAPLIALHPSAAPSRLTVIAGRLASMLLPSRQLVSKLDEKVLSRDPEVVRLYVEDELCHDTGTLQGLAGMLDRGAHLVSGRVKLPVDDNGEGGQLRIWVGHGTEDRVTSFEASRKWMEELKVEDKEFKAYEGWYHKLHAEPGNDRVTFANNVADWILARTSLPSTSSSTQLGSGYSSSPPAAPVAAAVQDDGHPSSKL